MYLQCTFYKSEKNYSISGDSYNNWSPLQSSVVIVCLNSNITRQNKLLGLQDKITFTSTTGKGMEKGETVVQIMWL